MKVNTETRRHRAFGFSVPLCLCVSILIHALLAIALSAYLEYAPHPDVLAMLDLSSVELSFAEKEDEAATVAPQPAMVERAVPSPPQEETPPEVKLEKPIRRELGEIKLPEPKLNQTIKQSEQSSNSPTVAPRQARLDAPPKPKRNIKPDYPKGARQRGEQGDVVLEIRVNAEGTVDDVKVAISSGFAELDEAAVKAARTAKFSPARSGHDPVASTARLRLSFKLK